MARKGFRQSRITPEQQQLRMLRQDAREDAVALLKHAYTDYVTVYKLGSRIDRMRLELAEYRIFLSGYEMPRKGPRGE